MRDFGMCTILVCSTGRGTVPFNPNLALDQISVRKGNKINISRSIKEIEDAKLSLQDNLRENLITDFQNETISNFNERQTSLELQSSLEDYFIFVCDTKEFDFALSRLGSIEKPPVEYLSKNKPKSLNYRM